jgi:hypothetical protein
MCALLLLNGCGSDGTIDANGGGTSVDTTAPQVRSTTPADNAVEIATNAAVNITFSEAMDPTTLTIASLTLTGPSGNVPGAVTYSGGVTATFTPSVVLLPSSVYTVIVTTAAKDLAGNSLATEHRFTFTTRTPVAEQNRLITQPSGDSNAIAPQSVSDGAGGAIIVWSTGVNIDTHDIYAQRLNAAGVPQWTAGGVPISTATGDQELPKIVEDGAGGAIIVWRDRRAGTGPLSSDIFAQRVNSAGVAQWSANGIPISTAAGWQDRPQLVSDGAGGAVVVWEDGRLHPVYKDIYAQRVNSDGMVQWAADGIVIAAAAGDQERPTLATDGAGGAIIAWEDGRRTGRRQVFLQRVSSAGVVQWVADGVGITNYPIRFPNTLTGDATNPRIQADGAGGAIVVWEDIRESDSDYSTFSTNLYAQRVDSDGVAQWEANGISVSKAVYSQLNPRPVQDGAGGVIVAWQDFRSNSNFDVYAQRVNGAGAVLWAVDGVAISAATGSQDTTQLVGDGSGGAFIAWQDKRGITDYDIYARHLDKTGIVQWTADGVAISTAVYDQLLPQLVLHGGGGVIIVWQGERTKGCPTCVGLSDIYAQVVSPSGVLQ